MCGALITATPLAGQARDSSGSQGSSDNPTGPERYASFLSSFDADRNGQIDANEAAGQRGYVIRKLTERANMEFAFPLSIERLQAELKKHASPNGSSTSKSAVVSRRMEGGDSPLIAGFGVEQPELSPVRTFGEASPADQPGGASKPSSGTAARRPPSARPAAAADARIRGFAEAMIRQHDKNQNGRLERSEWSELRSYQKEADRNRDGVITVDEMAGRIDKFQRQDDSQSRSSHGSSHASYPSAARRTAADRKSYRFRLPTERLPDGLPSWFTEKDADADGQVAMAEYARFWTDAQAREFTRLDLNDDGFITPKECLAAEAAPD
jgi:hypothetical protein